jgi:MFS family permease
VGLVGVSVGGLRSRIAAGPGYPRWVLVTALSGLFATSFPIVLLVASLSTIADDLDTTQAVLAWVITAPMVASAVLMPAFGKLGDLKGHRRVFLVGFTVSAVLSLASAFAWNVWSLIALRTLAMAAGAATQPTGIALIVDAFPPRERVHALGYWSFVSAAGPALGLIVGGPMIDFLGWRTLFVAQAALCPIPIVLALLVLRPDRIVSPVTFDVRGAAALAVAAGGILFAINRLGPWGIDNPGVLVALGLGAVGALAFVRVERRAGEPLMPLGLLRNRTLGSALSGEFVLQMATMGSFVLTPYLVSTELGYSVARTSLVLLPMPVAMSVFSPLGGRIAARIGERAAVILGCLAMLVGMIIAAAGIEARSGAWVAAALAIQGAANGVARPSLAGSAANAVPARYYGIGMGVQRMLSLLGAATGITLLVLLDETWGFRAAYAAGGIIALAALLVALGIEPLRRESPEAELAAEMLPSFES